MKKTLILAIFSFLFISACSSSNTTQNAVVNSTNRTQNVAVENAPTNSGVIIVKSQNNFDETYKRLKSAIEKNEALKIIAEINHAENAEKAELTLRPTKLIIFGNPKLGTPLMQEAQILGIDLPQKFLVYENEKGEIFIAYNDPSYLARRHNINEERQELSKISAALKTLAKTATDK